ncbi:hypothetical protein PACTADRAFT_16363 [Pachysolen tannophilus NRRL Y-2460]|uniref:non-specific serine/threonine protein kinase n=1 Tax=Pachysolen tannophilus NRRL Y-2460 TaxID=669874 RepID=A0A1E4TWW0_PACTA|nr:hypothetical protein PACTADRAFT_16363 [Pachysolen tannophilus NRRL Y-2460]
MVSSIATIAAKKAASDDYQRSQMHQQQRQQHYHSNVVSSVYTHSNGSRNSNGNGGSYNDQNKENVQQLDRVVESVANATKRLSQVSTNTTNSSKRKSQNHVGPWRLGRTLGRGSTGRVRLAKHSITGQLAAVKIVPKLNHENANKRLKNGVKVDNNGLPYGIEREIIVMKLISHQNIMALYDVWENKNELYLVLEYIEGGELFDYLIRKGKLEEKEAVMYFKQIISGINYCHQFNICHRDLKPENLLLDKYRNIKIADFGMAALETTENLLETSCGSPHYASPEIVAGKNYHGGPSDIWSCGIILFALLTGHLPFDDPNIRQLLLKVQTGKFKMPPNLSSEAKDLIWKMLKVDPRERAKLDEIINHPLLKKYPSKKNTFSNDRLQANHTTENLDLSPVTEIDEQIVKNLQTLWHGIDKSKIIGKLQSSEKNSEKIFYQLLINYKKSHSKYSNYQAGDINNNNILNKKDSRKTIPRSTSVVTTVIQDENGNKIRTVTREIPNSEVPPHLSSKNRKALGTINQNSLNTNVSRKKTKTLDRKKPVISASNSYRKNISFKGHKKSSSSLVSASSSKRSIKSSKSSKSSSRSRSNSIGKNPMKRREFPALPEVRESKLNVLEFMYLCDEIFGEDEPQQENGNKVNENEIPMIINNSKDVFKKKEKGNEKKKRQLKEQEELKSHLDQIREKNLIVQKQRNRQKELELEETKQRDLLVERQRAAAEELKALELLREKEKFKFISATKNSGSLANTRYHPSSRNISNFVSLDPKLKSMNAANNENKAYAKAVLDKFGVRLSKFGDIYSSDIRNNTGDSTNNKSVVEDIKLDSKLKNNVKSHPLPPLPTSSNLSRKSSLVTSKSGSTTDLSSYLNSQRNKNFTLDQYNKKLSNRSNNTQFRNKATLSPNRIISKNAAPSSYDAHSLNTSTLSKRHTYNPSEDLSVDYTVSINTAEAIPISPVDKFTFNEPKLAETNKIANSIEPTTNTIDERFADAESTFDTLLTSSSISNIIGSMNRLAEDNNLKNKDDAESSIMVHKKAESNSTNDSNISEVVQYYPNIRSSLFNKNYDFPQDVTTATSCNSASVASVSNSNRKSAKSTPNKKNDFKLNDDSRRLTNLALDDSIYASLKMNKNFSKISIYADPDDSGFTQPAHAKEGDMEKSHDEDDTGSFIDQVNISDDLVHIKHSSFNYHRNNENVVTITPTDIQENTVDSLRPPSKAFRKFQNGVGFTQLSPVIEDTARFESNNYKDETLNRRKSLKLKRFFNLTTPQREAPRAPPYQSYDIQLDDEVNAKPLSRKKTRKEKAKNGVKNTDKHSKILSKFLRMF